MRGINQRAEWGGKANFSAKESVFYFIFLSPFALDILFSMKRERERGLEVETAEREWNADGSRHANIACMVIVKGV